MTITKVRAKRQITIPKEIFIALRLEVGDDLVLSLKNGQALLTPQRLGAKKGSPLLKPQPQFTATEEKTLRSAKRKIAAIQKDLRHAKGLTLNEAAVAVKAGLIARDQRWWWLEKWQAGERKAQADLDEGRVETYESAEAFLESLNS